MTLRREVETSSNLAITSLLYPNRHSDSGIVFYAHIHRSLVVFFPFHRMEKSRADTQIELSLTELPQALSLLIIWKENIMGEDF